MTYHPDKDIESRWQTQNGDSVDLPAPPDGWRGAINMDHLKDPDLYMFTKDGAHRVNMSDPYAAGYRPAVRPSAADTVIPYGGDHKPNGGNLGIGAHVDLSQIRACPDRQKAIDAYRQASSWEETDRIERPRRGIDWSLFWFLVVMAGIGLAIALGVAMVMA